MRIIAYSKCLYVLQIFGHLFARVPVWIFTISHLEISQIGLNLKISRIIEMFIKELLEKGQNSIMRRNGVHRRIQ